MESWDPKERAKKVFLYHSIQKLKLKDRARMQYNCKVCLSPSLNSGKFLGITQRKQERSACALVTLCLVTESNKHYLLYTHYRLVGEKDNWTITQAHQDYTIEKRRYTTGVYIFTSPSERTRRIG